MNPVAMKKSSLKGALMVFLLMVFFVSLQGFATQPAVTLSGYIYDSSSGNHITGAKVLLTSGQNTYSVINGNYSLEGVIPGIYTVTCTKPGFDTRTVSSLVINSGTTILNLALLPKTNPPGPVTAVIDSSQNPTTINIGWIVPSGPYEILYDDGIQDDFSIWQQGGNMNAVKFTPVGYPVTVTGGMVHVGNISNYSNGSNYLVPFQVVVYDAFGPGGTPGAQIGSPVDVIPSALGWIEFNFPEGIQIPYGNFYLVMIQGGNSPNAMGIAIDNTQPQNRSYSRNVIGNSPWNPAGGNFMIRARVTGPGGPLLLKNPSGSPNISYNIWRLHQGEEMNTAAWVDLGSSSSPYRTDNSWLSLPCGPYRWAVKTIYSGNRFSGSTFSNVIGKCWTTAVTVQSSLSCSSTPVAGTKITLSNMVYPDTLYQGYADSTGKVVFPDTWKGTYTLLATRFGYQDYSHRVGINSDTLFPVLLTQVKNPPSNLFIDGKSLVATWKKPVEVQVLLNEDWGSGSFSTNGWTVDGGNNWITSTSLGNPAPSAMFSWSPGVLNYSESLISKVISGQNAPVLTLSFNIYLDAFGNTTLNQMAVEIWNGSAWNLLRNYDNMNGDILWKSESVDISEYANSQFRIRFRAYGEDSYDINNWNIDNIRIIAGENLSVSSSCVLGYYFYLNNILCGFTTDTSYTIDGNMIQFGLPYNGCTVAVYASGYSQPDCYSFLSRYLIPPGNLTGQETGNYITLAWDRPPGYPAGLSGYNVYRDDILIQSIGNPDSLSFFDYGLYPGTYQYKVTARYDLTSYGFPGQFDESFPAGPVTINMNFAYPLPFLESWDQGTFAFNDWMFNPDQGNWTVETSSGNPSPCTVFKSQPEQINYSYSLISPALNATGLECARIWLDFDIMLQDLANTHNEKMTVDVYYNNTWHSIAEFSSDGTTGWISKHIDISSVRGNYFQIRFTAHGENSSTIRDWLLDNIHIYDICPAARNFSAEMQGSSVLLTWSPPQCNQGLALNEGFEEAFFPPDNWSVQVTNTGNTWNHSDSSASWGVHQGHYAAGIEWAYSHQDEWLIAHDVLVNGDLTFWSYAYQGSQHNDHYYVKISKDNGNTWTTLLDMSALPLFNGTISYNKWEQPYSVNLSPYYGERIDIAWQAYDGGGQGLWYNWAVDDCRVGSKKLTLTVQNDGPEGYYIYRKDPGSAVFKQLNSELVTDTSWVDTEVDQGMNSYFILTVFSACNAPSDTLMLNVITGVNPDPVKGKIKIYPNPAGDFFCLESSEPVEKVIISDQTGNNISVLFFNKEEKIKLSSETLSPGVYFLRIITEKNQYISKIVILH